MQQRQKEGDVKYPDQSKQDSYNHLPKKFENAWKTYTKFMKSKL